MKLPLFQHGIDTMQMTPTGTFHKIVPLGLGFEELVMTPAHYHMLCAVAWYYYQATAFSLVCPCLQG